MRGRKAKIEATRCAVGYCRVSKREQATDGGSLAAQENRLEALARDHGKGLSRVFVDPGFSGGSLRRPAVKELLTWIERGEVESLYVAKLDRLCRSLADLLWVVQLCEKHGVALVSAAENIDTGSPAGRMMISMLGAFGQFERERIAERIRDVAFDKRQQRKVYCGNTPFGYRREGRALLEDDRQQAALREMRLMQRRGASLRQIAAWLSAGGYKPKGRAWYAGSVRAVLQSRMAESRG